MADQELSPKIESNKQFPIGDIVDIYKDKKVIEWLESVADMGRERFWMEIRMYSAPTNLDGDNASLTHELASHLCTDWDKSNNDGFPYVQMGYRLAMTFNQRTRYLPKCDVDLSETIELMRKPDIEGGRLNSAREFGRTAWNSIAEYPNVYAVHRLLYDFAEPRYELYSDQARESFRAGMALPFMFAWASRLEGYNRQ